MKKVVRDVLNGTIGIFELVREKANEFVDKGRQTDGAFAKMVHESFSESAEPVSDRLREYLNKGLHAMNIATKDDLADLRSEWEGHKPRSGTPNKRNTD